MRYIGKKQCKAAAGTGVWGSFCHFIFTGTGGSLPCHASGRTGFFALKTMLKVFFTPLYCAQLQQGLNIRMRSFTHLQSYGLHKRVLPRDLPATHENIDVDPLVADPGYCDAVTDILRRSGIRVRPLLAHAAVSAAIHSEMPLPASIGIAETQGNRKSVKSSPDL